MAEKSTNAELMNRVAEVSTLLLEGRTRFYIIQYGSKWNLSDRQIDDYISMANKNLKEVNMLSLQENQATIVNGLWELFRAARSADDVSEQHKILMSIAKLKGLDQMTVNHIIEDKRELAEMTDEELDAIIVDPCPLPPAA